MYVSNLIITKNDHEKSSRTIIYCCVHFLMVTSNDLGWPEMTIRQKWRAVKRNTIFSRLVRHKILENISKSEQKYFHFAMIWIDLVISSLILYHPGFVGPSRTDLTNKIKIHKIRFESKMIFEMDWNRKSPKTDRNRSKLIRTIQKWSKTTKMDQFRSKLGKSLIRLTASLNNYERDIFGYMQTFCQIKLTLISNMEFFSSHGKIFDLTHHFNFRFNCPKINKKYQFSIRKQQFFSKMTPKKRNRNLTSQIYQSQIQQSTSSGSDPDQKVRIFEFLAKVLKKAKFTNFRKLKNQFHALKCYLKAKKARKKILEI